MKLKYVVLAGVVFGVTLMLFVGCGGSGDTVGPSTVTQAQVVTPEVAAAAPATPASTASAKVWAHGEVDVTGPWEGFVCYFWDGPHEQDKASPDVAVSIAGTGTKRIHFPKIEQNSPEHCRVQVDVGTDCRRSSIIPGMLAHGYVTVGECEKECVPGEDIVTDEVTHGEWTDGTCEVNASTTACFEHRSVTTVTTTKNNCGSSSSTVVTCEQREVKCPCEETWSDWKDGETTCGEWGECSEQPHSSGLSASCGSKCHKYRECTTEQTRTQTCTGKTETRTTKPKTQSRECECPAKECYYNVSGAGHFTQEQICEWKKGGDPYVNGLWGNWNDQHADQCKFTVPGIYSDIFRQFQLTPGQSDPRCNKY